VCLRLKPLAGGQAKDFYPAELANTTLEQSPVLVRRMTATEAIPPLAASVSTSACCAVSFSGVHSTPPPSIVGCGLALSPLACSFANSFRDTPFKELLLAPHSKRSSASDPICEANTKHKVWIQSGTIFLSTCRIPKCARKVHGWELESAGEQAGLGPTARGTGAAPLIPTGKLVMRVARVAPKRARCFNSKGTSFHVVCLSSST